LATTSRVIETLLLLKIETAVVLKLLIQTPLLNAPDGEEGEKTTMGFAAKGNGNVHVAAPCGEHARQNCDIAKTKSCGCGKR
jgi:hypothetical protein